MQRDLRSVWNSGYFEDVRMEREQSAKGWIIHIYVREKPTIRTIEYHGLNSVSVRATFWNAIKRSKSR